VLAGLAGHEIQRHQGRVGDRIVQIPDDQRQCLAQLGLTDRLHIVLDADRFCRLGCHVDLGVALAFEAGGEGQQVRVVLLGQRGDRGGVDAARQERADGDIGSHVLGDRIVEYLEDLRVQLRFGFGAVHLRGCEPRAEVPLGGQHTIAQREAGARLDAAQMRIGRLRLGYVLQDEVVPQGIGVDHGRPGQRPQALRLRREPEAVAGLGEIQRLDAEPVARPESRLGLGVPDDEREHAAQLLDPVGAVIVVARHDRLAVARRAEDRLVIGGQPGAQLDVVVDLPVEGHRVAVGIVRGAPAQRLLGAFDVDDAQPVEAEDRAVVMPDRGVVRPTMPCANHAFGDLADPCLIERAGRDEAHQATHRNTYRPADSC